LKTETGYNLTFIVHSIKFHWNYQ